MAVPNDTTDKSLQAMLNSLKIDYTNFPDEDRFTLRKIIKKSPHLKNAGIRHRKKVRKDKNALKKLPKSF